MFSPPERSPERDAAIDLLLPVVPFEGWTTAALRTALRDGGLDVADADRLFPGGPTDMVEAYCDLADRRMADAPVAGLRTPDRVRAVIARRFEQQRPCKEAVRRALSVLSWPGNAGLALACTARTVDAIWHVAGDAATGFDWYTKRATLAAVYGATLLRWLQDGSEDSAPTLAFLDRRLAGVGRVGRLRARLGRNRAA